MDSKLFVNVLDQNTKAQTFNSDADNAKEMRNTFRKNILTPFYTFYSDVLLQMRPAGEKVQRSKPQCFDGVY